MIELNTKILINSLGKQFILLLLYLAYLPFSLAEYAGDEEELDFIYGGDDLVSIATGHLQPLHKAPSVASIITADDILRSGARDIDDVLESVPGLHVSRSFFTDKPLYIFRGITSSVNPQVLMLVNGYSITVVQGGDRGGTWAGMPVEAIERIEIIRGPGSAVFGADAYAGVINIITKDYDSIQSRFGIGAGGFNTNEFFYQERFEWRGVKSALSLEYLKTDGHDEVVESDLQSLYDNLFGTSASLAPGKINTGKRMIEARFDFKFDDWQVRLGFQGRNDVGTGVGVSPALDPNGEQNAKRINFDINYAATQGNFENNFRFGFFDVAEKLDLNILPAGFSPYFPNGMIGQPEYYERHYNFEYSTFYDVIKGHKLRFGAGVRYDDLYKTREHKNFDDMGFPLGSLIDVSNDPDLIFARTATRKLHYLFVQDEWTLNNDVDLTLGGRFDSYSDVGDTFNPRLALVWQMHLNWTTKILYGRAFRPPSFLELYNQNNPITAGNVDLKPETIDSLEFATSYFINDNFRWDINLFTYSMNDVIRHVQLGGEQVLISQNIGRQKGHGIESVVEWQASEQTQWVANLAWVKNKDQDSNQEIEQTPQLQAMAQINWDLNNSYKFVAQWQYLGTRERSDADVRADLDDCSQLNLSANYRHANSPWDFRLSARNINDADCREPAFDMLALPDDIPVAGRQWLIQLTYRL